MTTETQAGIAERTLVSCHRQGWTIRHGSPPPQLHESNNHQYKRLRQKLVDVLQHLGVHRWFPHACSVGTSRQAIRTLAPWYAAVATRACPAPSVGDIFILYYAEEWRSSVEHQLF